MKTKTTTDTDTKEASALLKTIPADTREISVKILSAHEQVERFKSLSKENKQKSIQAAIEAGKLLIQAKESVGHKKWLPWLKEHCQGISEKTAQNYMRLANPKNVADLSQCKNLSGAYVATGILKKKTKPPKDKKGEGKGFSTALLENKDKVSVDIGKTPYTLEELVERVMVHLNFLQTDKQITEALVTLTPCAVWSNQQSKRLRDIVASKTKKTSKVAGGKFASFLAAE
jgi:hypothetical protein